MQSAAKTVNEYLAGLPPDRQEAMATLRCVILENLPEGYQEAMQYGMIGYVIPLERYPNTYNKQPLEYAALASQKQYISLYLMGVYSDPGAAEWFTERYRATGKRLNMGKSCVRFRKLEDAPLDLIAEAIARTPPEEFIRIYEESRRRR